MAIFRYEATDITGKEMRGAMDATDAHEVSRRLQEKGFRQVNVVGAASSGAATSQVARGVGGVMPSSVAAGAATVAPPRSIGGWATVTAPPATLGTFFRQMASLTHAGFSTSASLLDLGNRTAHKGLAHAATEMGRATGNGARLSDQMEAHPGLFAPHIVGLVAAGETGGFLPFAYEEAALGAEQDAALRQGLWLPKVLIWNAVWTVLLMQAFFPAIDAAKLGNAQAASQVAAAFVSPLHRTIWATVIGILLHIGAVVVGKMRHQPWARDWFDAVSLRVPAMARLAKMRGMASFTRVLRRLLLSGISPATAYAAAANSVPNAVIRERLWSGINVVRGGRGLDEAIQSTGMMETDPLNLLITGQKTGQWVEMLDQVTAFYQDEAARATDAARAAQKRFGWLLTLIVNGYIMIAITHYGYKLMFSFVDEFGK